MGLLSSFKRKAADSPGKAAEEQAGDAVQVARTRARRRLIGAVVLLLIGIIGFPIVFETQPRPIPLDIPIEIPRKDAVAPLVMPAPRPAAQAEDIITEGREADAHGAHAGHSAAAGEGAKPATAAQKPVAEAEQPAAASKQPDAQSPSVQASQMETAGSKRPVEAAKPAPETVKAAAKPADTAKPTETAKASEAAKKSETAAAAKKAAAAPADAARARALLADSGHAASDGGRYVVQVGAFADAGSAREVRQRVEKLGLKTYTQVAQTAAGNRIRVRVGPFATRDEADRALAKARGAGLTAVVLTL
jgi:DedD protein